MSKKEAAIRLTENEGCVLSNVNRFQPVTAYKITKSFKESPVPSFNSSVGHIYPMINRFAERGLITGEVIDGDSRGTKQWSMTDLGRAALRRWVYDVQPDELLAHDSLRVKILSFGMLSHQDRIDWVIMSKAQLEEKMRTMTEWQKTLNVPFSKWAHDNATSTLKARMEWLDRMLFDLITEGPSAGES